MSMALFCRLIFFSCVFWFLAGAKQALISLSDKRNLELLAKGLEDLG